MSSTTPGTQVQRTSPINERFVPLILVLLVGVAAVVLAWGVHDRNVEADYLAAFEQGGVTAVVEHAGERGDTVTPFDGGVKAPYGCYLDVGVVIDPLTVEQCAHEASVISHG